MSAREFIENDLIPWLEAELADNPPGNKHLIAGFEIGLGSVRQFIELRRPQWDIEE